MALPQPKQKAAISEDGLADRLDSLVDDAKGLDEWIADFQQVVEATRIQHGDRYGRWLGRTDWITLNGKEKVGYLTATEMIRSYVPEMVVDLHGIEKEIQESIIAGEPHEQTERFVADKDVIERLIRVSTDLYKKIVTEKVKNAGNLDEVAELVQDYRILFESLV